jgi:hypothetical protein
MADGSHDSLVCSLCGDRRTPLDLDDATVGASLEEIASKRERRQTRSPFNLRVRVDGVDVQSWISYRAVRVSKMARAECRRSVVCKRGSVVAGGAGVGISGGRRAKNFLAGLGFTFTNGPTKKLGSANLHLHWN